MSRDPTDCVEEEKILEKKASLRVVSYTLYISSRPHMKLVIWVLKFPAITSDMELI